MEQIFTLHYNTRSITRKKSIEVITILVKNFNYEKEIEQEIKNRFTNMNIFIESTNNVIHKFISNDSQPIFDKIKEQLKELWNKYQSEIPFLIQSNFGIFCQ